MLDDSHRIHFSESELSLCFPALSSSCTIVQGVSMTESTKTEKKVATELKSLINKEGYGYIYDNAYDVYNILLDKKIDKNIASALLYALVCDIARENKDDIKGEIGRVLSLNEEMSTSICNIFSSLYGSRSLSGMKKKEYLGLEEFCSKEWEMCASGAATWEYKYGSKTDYSFSYYFTLKVSDRALVEKDLRKKLEKNPFMKAEDIASAYEEEISSIIADDFEDYCTCDDYYPPVVEDFDGNCAYDMKDYLPKHGLELVSDEYEYHESDIY